MKAITFLLNKLNGSEVKSMNFMVLRLFWFSLGLKITTTNIDNSLHVTTRAVDITKRTTLNNNYHHISIGQPNLMTMANDSY